VKRARRTFLFSIVLAGLLSYSCESPPGPLVLSPAQQSELKTFTSQLSDPSRSAQTKLEAASLLLSRTYPQAQEAVRHFLLDSGNPSGQLAVAEGIARQGGGEEMFIDPLFALLKRDRAGVRAAAGRALGSYGSVVSERLIDIASDESQDRPVRLVSIASLGAIPDKRVVEVMIDLLGEDDEGVQQAAGDALVRLTDIRSFGTDAERWRTWWEENKSKKRTEWLADLADGMARAKSELEAENAALRERLAAAMRDIYDASPPAQRDAMLLNFLNDPLAEVRVVGMSIIDRRLAANTPVADEFRLRVRSLVTDGDVRCREAAALLLANLGDSDALPLLLERLQVERELPGRLGLLAAVGQLRGAEALPTILDEVPSVADEIATVAAEALGRIVEVHPLDAEDTQRAVEALTERYRSSVPGKESSRLREALLTAMGLVGDKGSVEVIRSGLQDEAATVRLAAVGALKRVGNGESGPLVVPLVNDSDRGVRQAAIGALGELGGQGHLQIILERTKPSVEDDEAVRSRAWEAVMGILSHCDPEILLKVADDLTPRKDATDQRIEILKMLVSSYGDADTPSAADAKRRLGLILVQAGRPAEAGPHLEQAWKIYQQEGGDRARDVWQEWIDALLAADDPQAIRAIAEQTDPDSFAAAMRGLDARLAELTEQGNCAIAILMADESLKILAARLTPEKRKAIRKLLDDARSAQQTSDRLEVGRALKQLRAADEQGRRAGLAKLSVLGDRAAIPLLLELQKVLQSAGPEGDDELETIILGALVQIDPSFNKYDPGADKNERIKVIEERLISLRAEPKSRPSETDR